MPTLAERCASRHENTNDDDATCKDLFESACGFALSGLVHPLSVTVAWPLLLGIYAMLRRNTPCSGLEAFKQVLQRLEVTPKGWHVSFFHPETAALCADQLEPCVAQALGCGEKISFGSRQPGRGALKTPIGG